MTNRADQKISIEDWAKLAKASDDAEAAMQLKAQEEQSQQFSFEGKDPNAKISLQDWASIGQRSDQVEQEQVTQFEQESQPVQNIQQKANDLLQGGAQVLGEVAAGAGRGIADLFEIVKRTDETNRALEVMGSPVRIPTVQEMFNIPEAGAFMGEGLPAEIVGTAAEFSGGGGGLAAGAKGLAKATAKAGEKLREGVVRSEAALGAAAGTGAAVGGDVAGTPGEIVGAIAGGAGFAGVNKLREVVNATPDQRDVEVIRNAAKNNIDILATDVVPPDTFLGKNLQSLGEKLGFLGTGGMRAKQQEQRVILAEQIARDFGIDPNDFNLKSQEGVIKGLRDSVLEMKARGAEQRQRSFELLNNKGTVQYPKTERALTEIIRKEATKGKNANTDLVNKLQNTYKNLTDLVIQDPKTGVTFNVKNNFEQGVNQRSTIIDELMKIQKKDNDALASVSNADLTKFKKAMDEDLKNFAKRNDRDGAAAWIRSNRIFAEGYTRAKETTIQKLINKGQETPELVTSLLSSQKVSDIRRLTSKLDEKGMENYNTAVMQKVFQDSGFFKSDDLPNPNRLSTALNKNKKLIQHMTPNRAKEIDGVRKVLQATRRAQDASATPTNGVMMLYPLLGIGASNVGSLPTAVFGGGAISALTKFYESNMNRKLLMKIGSAKKGSKAEEKFINEYMQTMQRAAVLGAIVQDDEQPEN